MTVQKDVTKNIYVGNGSTRTFPFTFECPAEHPEYIKVYLMQDDGTALTTSDYQLDMDARHITYPSIGTALPEGKKLVIMRELPLQQMMNLVNNGPYFAEDVELAFDENVMAMQQIAEKLNRSIIMSVDIDGDAFVNEVPFEAGKSFRIADDGKSIVLTEDPARVLPLAQEAYAQAQAQAQSASASAAAAAQSEDSAFESAGVAGNSAQYASASAASAAENARLAEGYKTAAETAKSNASLYAANAKTSADNAGASKEAAQSAATTASNFASDARNSADEAKSYRDATSIYAANAKNYSENVNVFVPSVDADGTLTWTNKAGLANPAAVNIKGAKGDKGDPGPQGPKGDGAITVDAALSDTSINPVQNKVIKREFDELLLPDGTLSIPSSDNAYISKVASDSMSIINDITQTVIEQSADGVTWETLFDSNTLGAAAKAVYVNGLHLGKTISITKGYVARITFDTHATDYFSTIAMYMVLNDDVNGGEQSYKWYAGFNNLSDAPRGKGAFSTFGSTPSATFRRMTYNKVRYVFNEDKKAVNLSFWSVLCKGTVPYRSVLKYDSNKKRTVTDFPIAAPSFLGTATKATQDGDGNVISTTYAKSSAANMWEEQQDFMEVKLGYEKYLSRKISNTGSKPTVSLMQYEATGAFTLDLSRFSTGLQINESTVFTAYITSSADYPLTITNAGTIKYIGSASDVAITSAGLLLNILMMKDESDTVTSIVQASKLEGGA